MKKILFILALLLCPLSVPGQQGALQGTSTLGGISATTQGAQSSNKLQGVIPAAKISIYLTNTTTLATLTTDGTHSLSNPFYSNASNAVNPGGFVAFAATNVGYDIVASSGQGVPNCTTGPLCYTLPVTLCKDCYPTQSFTPVVGAFQTNGVNNSNQALLNHVDTATVKFTNPSGGVESATVPNATNSSLGAAQCDGITIKCASGVLSTIPGSGLDMFVNAPTTGTWLPIYPTGYTITGQQSYSTATASNTAGQIVDKGCPGLPYCAEPLQTTITWTFTIPSYINPSNITSIYATGIGATSNFGAGGGFSPSAYLDCYQSATTYILYTGINGNSPQAQYNVHLTGVTGSQIPTITCAASVSANDPVQGSITNSVPAILLQVADSVDTAPASGEVQVLTPLYYNPSTATLGIDPLAAFQGINVLATTVAGLPVSPTQYSTYQIRDGNTATDCTVGGGSNRVNCYWNGSTWTGTAVGGVSGFPITLGSTSITASSTTTAVTGLSVNGVTLNSAGSNSLYLNQAGGYTTPSGGGGTTTNALTAAASGGAAPNSTFNGASAVTFDYHSFGAPGLAATTNTFSGTTNDFSGTSQLKLPVGAGYASAANGEIGYDSTNNNFHAWVNGADTLLVPLASGFVSGHCGQPTSSGGSWTIVDVGGACGVSGGGSAFSAITSGTNTTAAMLVGTGASLGTTGTGSIGATAIDGVTVTGIPTAGQVPTATSGSAATWQAPSGAATDILAPGKPSGTLAASYVKNGTVASSGTWTLLSYVPTSITAWSITSNVATFTATNAMTAGQQYVLSAFGTSTFFNGQTVTVLSTGLSTSQFEVSFTHANGSATESGTATPLPGYVSRVWGALSGANYLNCTVKIYINGSGTASISVPLQNFFLTTPYAYENARTPQALSTYFTNFNQTGSSAGTFGFSLPIPFTSGILVTIINTSGSTLANYDMVEYHMGVPNTWAYTRILHVDVNTDVTGITANTATTLTNYTGGNPGRFVGMYWFEDEFPGSISPFGAPMEGAFKLTLDGASVPSITSSGTEDWFGYGYYFASNGLPNTYSGGPGGQLPGGWTDASGQITAFTEGVTNYETNGAVRWHLNDPIYFNSALNMTWACGNTSYVSFTGTCTLWSTVFYYTQN